MPTQPADSKQLRDAIARHAAAAIDSGRDIYPHDRDLWTLVGPDAIDDARQQQGARNVEVRASADGDPEVWVDGAYYSTPVSWAAAHRESEALRGNTPR